MCLIPNQVRLQVSGDNVKGEVIGVPDVSGLSVFFSPYVGAVAIHPDMQGFSVSPTYWSAQVKWLQF